MRNSQSFRIKLGKLKAEIIQTIMHKMRSLPDNHVYMFTDEPDIAIVNAEETGYFDYTVFDFDGVSVVYESGFVSEIVIVSKENILAIDEISTTKISVNELNINQLIDIISKIEKYNTPIELEKSLIEYHS